MSQSSIPMSTLLRWRARLIPEAKDHGWVPFYNLGYLVFPFLPIVLSLMGDPNEWPGPVSYTMVGPTLLAMAVFLPLYFVAYRVTGLRSLLCLLSMAGIGYALMPFNSFANAYIIYAVGFAAMLGGSLWIRLAWTAAILIGLLFEIIALQYPVFIFLITLIISVAVFFGNHHFVESTRKRAELKLSYDEVRRLATFAERERIGRDLHDLLGHTLSLVALKSELAGKLLRRDPDAAHREIVEVSRVAREALAQVRSAVTGIRAAGIAAELVSAKLLLDSDGIVFEPAVAPRVLDGGMLPSNVEAALALTIREAVTNIQRHARARQAQVALDVEEGAVDGGEAVLCVEDDGRGGAIAPGNGLTGMRERIEALGGRLRIDSRKGEGTRIEVRVPLAAHAGDDVREGVKA